MITLNYRDSAPIYEQIKAGFRRLIITGALSEGERLPSVRALAKELAINPNTIQRAYSELENEGYICSAAGKGSFVTVPPDENRARRTELLERIRAAALELRCIGVSEEELAAAIAPAAEEEEI